MDEQIRQYISIFFSIFALIFSAFSLYISIKKYRIEKSKLAIQVLDIGPATITKLYPSMEDGRTKYEIKIRIQNKGYKEEMITAVRCIYNDSAPETKIEKIVKQKSQEIIEISLERDFVMKLKRLQIIPLEDKIISINSRELSAWKKEINERIVELSKTWKAGIKIGTEI